MSSYNPASSARSRDRRPGLINRNRSASRIASSLPRSLDPLSQPLCLPCRAPLTSGTHRLDRVVLARRVFLFVTGRGPTRRGSLMLSRRAAPRISQLHAKAFSMGIHLLFLSNQLKLTKNSHGLKSRPRFIASFEIESSKLNMKSNDDGCAPLPRFRLSPSPTAP